MKKVLIAIVIIAGALLAVRAYADVPSTPNYWQAHGHTISPINPYGVSFGNATATNLTVTGTCTGCGGIASGTGISTLNGQTGTTQTFATSTTATGLTQTITSSSNVHTWSLGLTSGYNIPLTASTTNWNTFYNTPSNRISDGTGLTWSGNTLNCDTASGSVQGCLSSSDWTTFNNKQAAISLTTTGTSGAATFSSNTLNIPQYQAAGSYVANSYASSTFPSFSYASSTYQTQGNYITALTGDVSASGPGSAAATLATVNSNTGSFGGASSIPTFTVNGKGLITAAGSATPSIPVGDITGVLPAANGGTGAPALTASDILFGNGTSPVATSSSFTFSAGSGLTVSATSTLATTTVTNLTVSQAPKFSSITGSTQCLHVDTTGLVSGTGSDCGAGGGGGGSISTSTTASIGKVAVWTGLATLGNGSLIDNGTVAGVNATSSSVTLNVQGSAGNFTPLSVASSTGRTIFKVLGNNTVQVPVDASTTMFSGPGLGNVSAASTTPVLLLGSQSLNAATLASSQGGGPNGVVLGSNMNGTGFAGDFLNFQGSSYFGGSSLDVFSVAWNGFLTLQSGAFENSGLSIKLTDSVANVLFNGPGGFYTNNGDGYSFQGSINNYSNPLNSINFFSVRPTMSQFSNASSTIVALNVGPSFYGWTGNGAKCGCQFIGERITPIFGNGDIFSTTSPQIALLVNPTINMSGSSLGGYTAFQINSTETSLPSSPMSYLLQAGTSTNQSMVVITNKGNVGVGTSTPTGALTLDGTNATLKLKFCFTMNDTVSSSTVEYFYSVSGVLTESSTKPSFCQ